MPNSERMMNILAGASELPSEKRAAFLDAACRGDSAMRAEVESLLNSHDDAGPFLSDPTVDLKPAPPADAGPGDPAFNATLASLPRELEGQMIGRYKLLQPIGEGGFGSVWMAEQREPVKRRVALKIIKLGMDTRQVIARFEAERQALAMMDHPNIAKVLDAGSTDTGRPYFVMEYIKGVPILEYCDAEKLDTRSRLGLFAVVCQAIQHAHQKGIIHRDIKPGNVLVTMHDGVPVPKVIDFGIAKATSGELTQKTLFTEHRQMIGTPAYMSPEQAEMSGLDVDTRSDIYSLGVLLYELLTGTTPFAAEDLLSRGFAEMMRIIREVEPQRPSNRLSTLGAAATRTAQQRLAGDPRRLMTILQGDLDWIVMKCLEKDRSRRYESAGGLAADIRRHLNDEPVTAGAPSARYRLAKFAKRNRGKVIAGAGVAAALVLGIIGTTAGMIHALNEGARANTEASRAVLAAELEAVARLAAEQNEQRAIAEAKRAESAKRDEADARKRAEESKGEEARARKRAETISEFVTAALRSGDAHNLGQVGNAGQDMTILAAMDNAVKDINAGRFIDDPETDAALRRTIAQILCNNGRVAEAEPLAVRALELTRKVHGADHPDLAASLELVACVKQGLGRLGEADPLMTESLAMRRRLREGDDPALAGAINSLAGLRSSQGRLAEALSLYSEALEVTRRCRQGDHPEIAICLNNIALDKQAMGRMIEAEPLFVEALEMHRRLYTGDHPEIAAGLNNLGYVRGATGRHAEAEKLFVQAVAMRERLYKGDHPATAVSLTNLAATRQQLRRFELAQADATRALEMNRRLYPKDHPAIARSLSCVASILQSIGRINEAELMFAEATESLRRAYPGDHPDLATSINNLAVARLELGRTSEAESLLASALQMRERLFRGDHPLIVATLNNLARVLHDLGRDSEADSLLERAQEMTSRLGDRAASESQAGRTQRAVQLWSRGELDKSIPLLEELLKEQESELGQDHRQTQVTAANLGVNYKDSGRLAEAIPLLEAAHRAAKRVPELAFADTALLDAYSKTADSSFPVDAPKAIATSQEILTAARGSIPSGSPELAARISLCAQSLLALKAWDQAESLAREALTIRQSVQPDAWNTFATRSVLGGALLGQGRLAEAEPLLLEGYRGMKDRLASIPMQGMPRMAEAIHRLEALYLAKGDTAAAEQWRSERAKFAASGHTPAAK